MLLSIDIFHEIFAPYSILQSCVYLIDGSRLRQSMKKRHEAWYRKIASILLDRRFHSRSDTLICMQRRLFLSSSDSDKFIVTFILNSFDPPSPLSCSRLVLSRRYSFRFRKRSRDTSALSGGLYLWSLSSLDRNRAHRHPTRKGAPTCNAEMGSEVGSHVYSIEERPVMSGGLYTKALPKSNLPLRNSQNAQQTVPLLQRDSFFTSVQWIR